MIGANSWCGNGGHLILQWDMSSGFYPISAWTYIKSALIAQKLPEPEENYFLLPFLIYWMSAPQPMLTHGIYKPHDWSISSHLDISLVSSSWPVLEPVNIILGTKDLDSNPLLELTKRFPENYGSKYSHHSLARVISISTFMYDVCTLFFAEKKHYVS